MTAREMVIWHDLVHDNILPLLGYVLMADGDGLPYFISPWMDDGNLRVFLKKNPDADILTLVRNCVTLIRASIDIHLNLGTTG